VALFLVVISALLVVARILPVWAVPVIMVGGLLSVSILGAFQLRHDEKLTERGFLRLMLVAVRTLPGSATAPAPDDQQR
jgi:predicted benzoate:H+ symporter BenE